MLIHRSSGNSIHDNRIVANRGGAGVMLTGDDGSGNPTPTTTVHNKVLRNEFLDNGDGLELTRGAAFNLVAGNVFRSTAANPEPSQGIEILLGHDNVLIGNRFENYSDGVQINGGNRNFIADNTFTGNTFGLSLSGAGNVIADNTIFGNAVGIAVRPSPDMTVARLSRNLIYDNGRAIERCFAGGSCDPNLRKGAIVFGLPGLEHERYVGKRGIGVNPPPASLTKICPDGAPNCQAAPNRAASPRPRSSACAGARRSSRCKAGCAARRARASPSKCSATGTRAAAKAKSFSARPRPRPMPTALGIFALTVDAPGAMPASFTATATSSDGATSEFRAPVALSE